MRNIIYYSDTTVRMDLNIQKLIYHLVQYSIYISFYWNLPRSHRSFQKSYVSSLIAWFKKPLKRRFFKIFRLSFACKSLFGCVFCINFTLNCSVFFLGDSKVLTAPAMIYTWRREYAPGTTLRDRAQNHVPDALWKLELRELSRMWLQ